MIHPPLQFLIDHKHLLPEDLALLLHPYLQNFPKLKIHIFCLSRILILDMEDVDRVKALNKIVDRCMSILGDTNPEEQSRFGISNQLKRSRETIRAIEYGRKSRLMVYTRYKLIIEGALNEAQNQHKS